MNKLEHLQVYQIYNVSVVMHFSHMTYEYCQNSNKTSALIDQYRCYIKERLQRQIRCNVQSSFRYTY